MRLSEMWTLGHATRLGLAAGLAALLLWPAYALLHEPMRGPFMAALGLTCFCGLSILFITVTDMMTVRRGRRILPARVFDLLLGSMLALPTGAALSDLMR